MEGAAVLHRVASMCLTEKVKDVKRVSSGKPEEKQGGHTPGMLEQPPGQRGWSGLSEERQG